MTFTHEQSTYTADELRQLEAARARLAKKKSNGTFVEAGIARAREIALKYAGVCARCGTTLPIGAKAHWDKSIGVFCPDCKPKSNEEADEFRRLKRELRAEARRERKESYEYRSESFNDSATVEVSGVDAPFITRTSDEHIESTYDGFGPND